MSVRDIGRASAAVLKTPEAHVGRTYELVSQSATGAEVAAALSEVSGVHCSWSVTVPKFIQGLMFADIAHMARWFEAGLPPVDTAPFKALVPDAWGFREYFKSRGKWASGEAFAPLPGGAVPPVPPPKTSWLMPAAITVSLVAVAAAFAMPYLRKQF